MARTLSVLVLGISTIVLGAVLPVSARHGGWPSAWITLPSIALVLGVVMLATKRPRFAATAMLLVGVPLGLSVVLVIADTRLESFGVAGLSGACAALVAYGLAVAHAVSAASPLAPVVEKGLAGAAPTLDDRARRWRARVWMVLGAVVGWALVVVAPTLGSRSELRRAYGDAAPDAEALVALAAVAAGLLVAGVAVAGAMRRVRRDGSMPRFRFGRTAAWIAVALLAIALVLLRRLA